jgi:hypothetical protein
MNTTDNPVIKDIIWHAHGVNNVPPLLKVQIPSLSIDRNQPIFIIIAS